MLIKLLGCYCQMTLKTYVRTLVASYPRFLPFMEEEMSLGMRQELGYYSLFADTMAPISPDSATGDGPSFISLLDPRTGKVFLQWESHIHCFLWTPHFVEFFTTFSD